MREFSGGTLQVVVATHDDNRVASVVASFTGQSQQLTELARKIRTGHGQVLGLLKKTAVIARELGQHLIEAKKLVVKGGWRHCSVSLLLTLCCPRAILLPAGCRRRREAD